LARLVNQELHGVTQSRLGAARQQLGGPVDRWVLDLISSMFKSLLDRLLGGCEADHCPETDVGVAETGCGQDHNSGDQADSCDQYSPGRLLVAGVAAAAGEKCPAQPSQAYQPEQSGDQCRPAGTTHLLLKCSHRELLAIVVARLWVSIEGGQLDRTIGLIETINDHIMIRSQSLHQLALTEFLDDLLDPACAAGIKWVRITQPHAEAGVGEHQYPRGARQCPLGQAFQVEEEKQQAGES
jgi:hypothetical protein